MEAWKGFCVPQQVLQALEEDGFTCPTSIQMMTLPAAIKSRRDILGAAETGSGKTLAFAIPLLHHIINDKESFDTAQLEKLEKPKKSKKKKKKEKSVKGVIELLPTAVDSAFFGGSEGDVDLPPDEPDFEMEEASEDLGLVKVVNLGEEALEEELEEEEPSNARPLYALVLAPTRELAAQVKAHIDKAARYTGIKTALVVGGLAEQKQKRMLKKQPEIVIGTPGRLWELIQQGAPHLSKVNNIKYLVVDEADRMVERGHFEELDQLFERLNSNGEAKKHRQTLVFSATLTLVHDVPDRLKKIRKKKIAAPTEKQKIDDLMQRIGFRDKPKVIDLTQKCGTARTLVESRISCSHDEKDAYLYYFLVKHPGRTLVFGNSKDCIRRLSSIFQLLQCAPLPLHADMHQHQRLKNLDKFKANPRGLLLATDVAARGLDIPDIQHVIHYQVPRTSESYVHRSGRTARASKEGITIMLVAPDEVFNYRKILKTIHRDEDLPMFPVDMQVLKSLKDRLSLACAIDKEEHQQTKKVKANDWITKAAKEMDIDVDDDLLYDIGDQAEQSSKSKKLKAWRNQLKSMLKQPITGRWETGRYPTKEGKLVSPFIHVSEKSTAVEELRLMDSGPAPKKRKTEPAESQIIVTENSRKKKKKKDWKKGKIVSGKTVNLL